MRDHLIFYDESCPFCRRCVAQVIAWDEKSKFMFASIHGKTAKQALKGKMSYLRQQNTLILVENVSRPPSRVWIRGQAVFRILKILGKKGKWLGWMAFLPFLPNLGYRVVAKFRYLIKMEDVPERFFRAHQQRFLP